LAQRDYIAPTTVQAAVDALVGAGADARVLSGGTDLIVQMRAGRVKPGLIVDLKALPGAIGVRRGPDGGFVIGAATSGAELGDHAELVKAWPGVVEGMNLIGSTQVQGRASLAGNLCNASPAADSVPAMVAARAVAVVVGPSGQREVPVEQIPVGPGRTSLAPGEFVMEFKLPPRAQRASDAYLRFIPRTEMDIAVVGAGVSLTVDAGGTVTAARVSLGAVAPRVLLVPQAAAAIVGSRLDGPAQERLEAAARAACSPIDDKRGTVEFRVQVAGVLARRAALIALDRARTR
jgi:CO/xanthine dehydrogenase FAD-binding subunit